MPVDRQRAALLALVSAFLLAKQPIFILISMLELKFERMNYLLFEFVELMKKEGFCCTETESERAGGTKTAFFFALCCPTQDQTRRSVVPGCVVLCWVGWVLFPCSTLSCEVSLTPVVTHCLGLCLV